MKFKHHQQDLFYNGIRLLKGLFSLYLAQWPMVKKSFNEGGKQIIATAICKNNNSF